MARGHFHEKVGETPIHLLPLGVGPTPKPFSLSENVSFEIFEAQIKIYIHSKFNHTLKCSLTSVLSIISIALLSGINMILVEAM